MKLILNHIEVNVAILSMVERIQKVETEKLCIIAILKGGVPTAHRILDLLPNKENVLVGYMGISSYHNGTTSNGKIKTTYLLDLSQQQLTGKDVWIIDDIFDSGLTMVHVKRYLQSTIEFCTSIRTAVLVQKINPKVKNYTNDSSLPDVVGFEYEKQGFLVGMGMGHGEKFRCLDQLYELEPHEIG
jgi:hypoxanthine phosphoribosyltransferase